MSKFRVNVRESQEQEQVSWSLAGAWIQRARTRISPTLNTEINMSNILSFRFSSSDTATILVAVPFDFKMKSSQNSTAQNVVEK